ARGVSLVAGAALPEPDINLYGLSPIVISAQPGFLSIERLDLPAPPLRIELPKNGADLREKDVALAATGLYRFTFGEASIVVRIDGRAEPGRAPAVGRLVIFR